MVEYFNVYTNTLEIICQGCYSYEYYVPTITTCPEMKDIRRKEEYDKYRAI